MATSQQTINLRPFLTLARELSTLFVPVSMRPEFRAGLEESLLMAARHQQAQDLLSIQPPGGGLLHGRREWTAAYLQPISELAGRRWLLGAALGSAVSIAGIVAYVWRQRGRHE